MKYEPEIGQALFGQPYNEYDCSELCIAALMSINDELERVMWNLDQKEYESPFSKPLILSILLAKTMGKIEPNRIIEVIVNVI